MQAPIHALSVLLLGAFAWSGFSRLKWIWVPKSAQLRVRDCNVYMFDVVRDVCLKGSVCDV